MYIYNVQTYAILCIKFRMYIHYNVTAVLCEWCHLQTIYKTRFKSVHMKTVQHQFLRDFN